jgi:hypothetical protein
MEEKQNNIHNSEEGAQKHASEQKKKHGGMYLMKYVQGLYTTATNAH